jgi:hypothetical protein
MNNPETLTKELRRDADTNATAANTGLGLLHSEATAEAIADLERRAADTIDTLATRLREVEERLEEERRYTDEEFAAMKDDEVDALARLLLRVPGPDKNVAALVAWVERLREVEEAGNALMQRMTYSGNGRLMTVPLSSVNAFRQALSTERTP